MKLNVPSFSKLLKNGGDRSGWTPGESAIRGLRKAEDAKAQAARRSLGEFIRQGWHVLEPSTPLEWNWHHESICLHLQAQIEDWICKQRDPGHEQRFQNLLINVPPGTMKSRITSVYLPAWVWLEWPSWKALFLAANPRVALRDSSLCRDLLQSDWYRNTFRPTWEFAKDQDAKSLYKNTEGGFRQAMGITAKITGERGDALFMDDPHDAKEVMSEAKRLAVIERWDTAIANRVNDARCSIRVGIMQRLHADDWSGHILKQGGWEHLCLPMEFEPGGVCQCETCKAGTTAIGWTDPRTEQKEILHPTRFPQKVLDAERKRLGSFGYAGQMQQSPTPLEGGMVKLNWFKRFTTPPANPIMIVQSWDTAQKAKQINDPWVSGTWLVTETGWYLVEVLRRRMEYPEGKRTAISQAAKWKPDAILIEDKSSGQSLIQELRAETDLPVIAIEPENDKITRMSVQTPKIEAGRVYLPDAEADDTEWLADYENELCRFPLVTHDDQTDMTSQFLKWIGDNEDTGPSITLLG